MLTPEKFELLMNTNFKDLYLNNEQRHINADILMCDMLRLLGYKADIEVFESAEKWYS